MSVPINKKLNKKIAKGFFITGTDTNIGKTLIASSISAALINNGKRVCAIKPLASGCNDALILKRHSTCNKLSHLDINPFTFRDPVAPHLVAKKNGVKLSVARIITKSYKALNYDADYIIIEGAGGWFTPISDKETMADLAKAYGYPVILVVGIRLGCINHAILTYKCMCDSGVKIGGWIANITDKKMLYLKENIESLKRHIGVPLLGIIPYMRTVNPQKCSSFLINFLTAP